MRKNKSYSIIVKGVCTEDIPLKSKPWEIIELLNSKGYFKYNIQNEDKLISFTHPDTPEFNGDSIYIFGLNNALCCYCNKPF